MKNIIMLIAYSIIGFSINAQVPRASGKSKAKVPSVKPSIKTAGRINFLNCDSVTHIGAIVGGTSASGASSTVRYTGGNAGTHRGQVLSSTGVKGLTATLLVGKFASGSGSLIYTITGTPSGSGTAKFAINIGGQSCTLTRIVDSKGTVAYPAGTVHCNGTPTAIVNVTNPITGNIWMDRNLGASQAATSSTDSSAYGDLYQWGRRADGHQCRNSDTKRTRSSKDQPAHGNFIVRIDDWRRHQNDNLWQGVTGVNNPCPSTYRVPTATELDSERKSWSSNDSEGAYASPLKLPLAGNRYYGNGVLYYVDSNGYYWSSSVDGLSSWGLAFESGIAGTGSNDRSYGVSVRCIKD